MDLREELARRLQDVAEGTKEEPVAHEYRYLADECLRQMEWARLQAWRQGRTSGFNAATYWPNDELHEQEQGPIRTLAPTDWKP